MDILRRYHALIAERGETYLWYFPDGRPASVETSTSPEAQPTDGWGSSAMLYALVEGLAGVEDRGDGASTRVRLAPRWAAADVDEAEVAVGYAASGARVGYRYERDGGTDPARAWRPPTSERRVSTCCSRTERGPSGCAAGRATVDAPRGRRREEPLRGLRRDAGRSVRRDRPGGGPDD